ncbi:hypothetical protein [Micromonospora sp. NPDC005367]|uniref:hypothetical protein n=1 Tax=Micromonospora sp. NPDC005367 TaxID=3155590 RepID=UPI0033AFF6D7
MPTIRDRQTAWSILTSAADDATAARTKTDQQIEKISTSDMYAPDYKTKMIKQQRDGLEQATKALLDQAANARDTLLEAARELDAPAGDATAQLLAETRAQRAWSRIKPQLDAGTHWSTLLDQAVAARDGGTLAAMRDELAAYLQASGGADASVDREQLRRALDVATFKALGDDNGPGTAARLRLHVDARYPLAETTISQASGGRNLNGAVAVAYARQEAEAIEAQLGGQAAGSDAD